MDPNNADNQQSDTDKPESATNPDVNLRRSSILTLPTEIEEEEVSTFCNRDVQIRVARWSFLTVMPVFFLLVLTWQQRRNKDVPLSLLIGIGIIVMYLIYFGLIASLFYSGSRLKKDRSLFRIWTKANEVPGWASMSVAVHQQLYPFNSIQSISEFSAIDGGISSYMLSNLGPFTWAIVAMLFAAQLHFNSDVFRWDIADVFEIIGVAGLVMIGVFELDPYNPAMKKFHYLGAAAGVGTILGYVVQGWSLMHAKGQVTYFIAPLIVGTIALIFFVWWQLSNRWTEQEQARIREKYMDHEPNEEEMKEIKALITKLSLRNVITEGIFLFCGALSLALWCIHYDFECCCGCAGPASTECTGPKFSCH